MSSIENLPLELQNKIMFYVLEHPCAKMIKSYRKPFKHYKTIGTCERCDRHGRKLNLDILAECSDNVCISCDNSCPFPADYCALNYIDDDESVSDSDFGFDSEDGDSDED